MIENKLIGEKIKSLRKKKNLTQTQLADLLNVSFQAVSNWERGLTQIDLDNLLSISKIFEVSVDMILSSNNSMEQLYLGIDGGGTKTEFIVFEKNGCVIKRVILSASNPNDIGVENCIKVLIDGINKCLIEYPNIKYCFAGVAGVIGCNCIDSVKNSLEKAFSSISFNIDGDIVNLIYSVDKCDIALIVGTGFSIFAINKEGRFRIGGWGYLLDNYGSGYDIGREVIRAFLKETENDGEKTLISKLFLQEYKGGIKTIIEETYKKGKAFIASFAHIAFKAYSLKDNVAKNILIENAKYIAKNLNVANEKYGCGKNIVLAGGIIENYKEPFLDMINSFYKANYIFPKLPQIFGACRKCIDKYGEIEKDFESNFIESYKKEIENE